MIARNKKLIISMIVVFVCACLFMSDRAFAASCGGIETVLISCEEGGDGGIFHILRLVIDIFSIGVGILAVVGISWAGLQYLTAKDSAEQTLKAKRRLFEIVIGVALYAVLYGVLRWLLLGDMNLSQDNTGVESVTISYAGNGVVGKTFTPTVTFGGEVKNKTYSLVSGNNDIIMTLGRVAKCVKVGTASVTALAANGKKASVDIQCIEETKNDSGSSESGSDTEAGAEIVGSMMNTKFQGKGNKPHVRAATEEIVENHNKDFYFSGKQSYKNVVLGSKSKYGSYEKYVSSLGGVFSQFANTSRIKVETAADFQIAAEYVFGLMQIWGQDYYNGTRRLWNTDDAFYRGYSNRSSLGYTKNWNINKLLKSFSTKGTLDTHCDKGINILLKSTSLKYPPGGSSNGKDSRNKSLVTYINKVQDLQVGDVVNFPGHHTAIVGEVYQDKLVIYDAGSRFQSSRNHTYKQIVPRKSGSRLNTGVYRMYPSWYAWRMKSWKIDQNKTLGGIN
ncbi:hypothetical protein IKE82_00665 [Candidatus Saccharibacteria bacterium]|nr:hypothetical protein [Candidatus Saccharibacteria bacterium]